MSLDFLTPGTGPQAPPAESPMTAAAAAAGATLEVRGGWRVAARFGTPDAERRACAQAVGWADASHLRKTELQGPAALVAGLSGGLRLGSAVLDGGAWWCPVTPTRALVLGGDELQDLDPALHRVDVTTQFCAMRIAGPAARETFARFCALDLRPSATRPGDFRPGSVARTPGYVLCEAPDRYLVLVGAGFAEYLWTVVSDAGERLGGQPVGVDAFAPPSAPGTVPAAPREEAGSHA